MYRIGLTGNIATGKSLVLDRLRRHGAYCLDADRLAHELMRRDAPAWQEVRDRFGEAVLGEDGEVDRRTLGAVVFGDAGALADLEAILHPKVAREIEERLAGSGAAVSVVEAIKLLEAGLGRRCHAVWVTTSAPEEQLRRLMRHRGLGEAEARLRMAAQPPAGDKVRRADVLLDNDGAIEDLLTLVDLEWRDIEAGRAPGRDTQPAEPVLSGGVWRVAEGEAEALAEPVAPASWRLRLSRSTRMPRLCRLLLPALEQAAAGRGGPTLLAEARTGYRQFMQAMGYEEMGDGGREPGTSTFGRAG